MALTEDPQPKRKVLHNSHVGLLLQCGYKYELIHVQGRRDKPSVPMVIGRAADETVSANLTKKANHEELMTQEEIEDISTDHFRRAWDESPLWFDNDEREMGLPKVKEVAENAVRRSSVIHGQTIAPTIQPLPDGVQWKWVLDGASAGLSFDLAGTLDALCEVIETTRDEQTFRHLDIRDLKAKAKKPSRIEIEHGRQPTIYSLAVKLSKKQDPRFFWMDCIIRPTKTLDARVETFQTTRGADDYLAYGKILQTVDKVLQMGAFLPADAERPYSPCHRCSFQEVCPYYNGRKTMAMPGSWLEDGSQVPLPEGEIHEVGTSIKKSKRASEGASTVSTKDPEWGSILPAKRGTR